MQALALPLSLRYVAVLHLQGGGRMFCCDHRRDEWTGHFSRAQTFPALDLAQDAARRHGGQAVPWSDAQASVAFEGFRLTP